MTKSRKRGRPGPALTIGIPLIFAAFAGSFSYQYYKDAKQGVRLEPEATKPSGPVVFRVAADPWSGYSTFRDEPRLKATLAKYDIQIEYLADEKYYDQDTRMKALAEGEVDVALTTLDAYLQHGAKHQQDGRYPGVIVFGIDESSGGDAIFLEKGRTSFDQVKPSDKVCFATGTPSEHLWDFASLAFANLGDDIETDNGVVAEDCWKKLEQGSVQIAVLWQPYTALAMKAGYHKVFATGGQADDVILDIAVANRDVVAKQPAALKQLLASYFQTIDSYQSDVEAHARFVTEDCGPDCSSDVTLGASVLEGIDFLTFEENLCIWFGHCNAPGKIGQRVQKTGRLLIAKGKLEASALPGAVTIVDDSFLVQLKQERLEAAELMRNVAGPGADVEMPTFTAQDPSYDYTVPGAEGGSVGTLELPNVFFREGSYGLTDDARVTIASIADRLRSFPALCVRIGGHTNSHGDAAANRKLSKYRGLAIAAELTRLDAKAFPKERFEVTGFGSDTPILVDGVEDPEASRRTEFTLLNCPGAG